MHLWPVEHFFPHFLTPFSVHTAERLWKSDLRMLFTILVGLMMTSVKMCAQQKESKNEENSVQLARGAFIINDFLRNQHFSEKNAYFQ